MRLNAMALGLIAWTLGNCVPAAYSVAMTGIALGRLEMRLNLDYKPAELMSNFNSMPLLMWIYTIAMGFIGLILVLHAFTRPKLAEQLAI